MAALLTSPKVEEAAIIAGVSTSTIYNRLRDPVFKQQYDEARLEMLRQHTAALQGHIGGAIETLAAVMNNENVPAQVRLNAAEGIIRNSLKLTEQTDILTRLKALEDAQNDQS